MLSALVARVITAMLWTAKIQAGTSPSPGQEKPFGYNKILPSLGQAGLGKFLALPAA